MTRMASYEANEGKKHLAIGKYFRSDYISIQLLKSLLSGTVVFAIITGMAVVYDLDSFMKNFYHTDDMIQMIKDIGSKYVLAIGVYLLLTYIIATYRYYRARKNLKTYYGNLKKLSKYYD